MKLPDFPKAPYPVVEVLWHDAASDDGDWVHMNDIPHTQAVRCIGYLIAEDKYEVTVSSQWGPDDLLGGVQTIPRGMVSSMRVIEQAPNG